MTLEIADLGSIPFYNADVRQGGYPEPVAELRAKVAAADGLLIASPEYNHSLTGILKNTIDWLSTSPDPPIDRKPTAIMGAGGRLGTAQSQAALRLVLAHNDAAVLQRPTVLVAGAWDHFDDELEVTNSRTSNQVRRLMFALAGHIRLHRNRQRAVVLAAPGDLVSTAHELDEAGYAVATTDDATSVIGRVEAGLLALVVAEPTALSPELSRACSEHGVVLIEQRPDDDFLDLLDSAIYKPLP